MPGLLFPFRQESSCSYLGIKRTLDFGWLTDLALRLLPFICRLQLWIVKTPTLTSRLILSSGLASINGIKSDNGQIYPNMVLPCFASKAAVGPGAKAPPTWGGIFRGNR